MANGKPIKINSEVLSLFESNEINKLTKKATITRSIEDCSSDNFDLIFAKYENVARIPIDKI